MNSETRNAFLFSLIPTSRLPFPEPFSTFITLLCCLIPTMSLLRCVRFFLFSVCAIQILIFAWLPEHLVVSLRGLFIGFPFPVPFSLFFFYNLI